MQNQKDKKKIKPKNNKNIFFIVFNVNNSNTYPRLA
jgi:hypothetical protein